MGVPKFCSMVLILAISSAPIYKTVAISLLYKTLDKRKQLCVCIQLMLSTKLLFSDKNINMFTFSGNKQLLLEDTMLPAVENTLSEGVDVAGIDK